MISFPGCKINIGLNIISKRIDGFHNLESIFYPVSWSDVLEFHASKQNELHTYGTSLKIKNEDNIVWKALELLKKDYKFPSIELHLLKNVPNGAGLGGGSADGSAALNLINQEFDLNISNRKLIKYAEILGSDCPFFIDNKPKLVSGRGEILESTKLSLNGYYLKIINPGIHVSTQLAFSRISPRVPEFDLKKLNVSDISNWKSYLKNDFEESVFEKYPEIELIKNDMYENGALYSSMTGTGSSVFGIFKNEPIENQSNHLSWIGKLN